MAEITSTNALEQKSIYINSHSAWIVLICCLSFYLYEYILRISPAVMTDQLMAHYGIAACGLGTLSSFYYLAYVPLQIPCGVIVDHIGPRITVSVSALLCVIGTLLFSCASNLYVAQLGRFLIGCGSACAYISCLKISSIWFDRSKFAFIAGSAQMIGIVGGIIGNRPLATLVNTIGWYETMLYAAYIGFFISIICWLVIRNRPRDIEKTKRTMNEHILQDLKTIVFKKQNLLVACYGFLMNIIITTFVELWGIPFIMERFNVNNEAASIGTTAVLVGFGIGSVSSAFLSGFFKSHIKVMKASSLATFLGFIIIIWVAIPYNALIFVLFIVGCFAGMQILYFTVASFNSPSKAIGTTIGFINAFVTMSGMIFQPLLGRVLEFFWDGTLKNVCVPVYSVEAYQYALSCILVCSFFAFIIMYFISETYSVEKESK